MRKCLPIILSLAVIIAPVYLFSVSVSVNTQQDARLQEQRDAYKLQDQKIEDQKLNDQRVEDKIQVQKRVDNQLQQKRDDNRAYQRKLDDRYRR